MPKLDECKMLGANPHAFRKSRDELKKKIGNRKFDVQVKLVFTNMFVCYLLIN